MRKNVFVLFASVSLSALLVFAQKPEEKRKVLFENERVRVREVLMEPGIDYAPHTHQFPHVGVIVKGGSLEFTEKGKSQTVDFKEGSVGWRDAGVTHNIRNVGKTTVHVVEVELKN